MAITILLPKLGLTMQEGTIEEWVATVGASVRHGDVLLRLATDKVDVEVEAEGEGVFHPAVAAGVTLPPGAVIGWLLAPGEQPPTQAFAQDGPGISGIPRVAGEMSTNDATGGATSGATAGAMGASTPSPSGAVTVGGRLLVSPNARRVAGEHGVNLDLVRGTGPQGRIVSEDIEDFLIAARSAEWPDVAEQPARPPKSQGVAGSSATEPDAGVMTSPLVRRYAENLGIDLTTVRGSGSGGRIRRADIDAAAAAVGSAGAAGSHGATGSSAIRPDSANGSHDVVGRQGASGLNGARSGGTAGVNGAEPVNEGGRETGRTGSSRRLPLTGMRRTIARRMHASLQEAAQLTLGYEVRVDAVLRAREQLKEELTGTDLPVPSLTDFIVRAAALALREHPMLNATVHDDGIEVHAEINVGLAVAVPGGLMVPVIHAAADRSLLDLAGETRRLAESARVGGLSLAQLEGGTFSVTTLGSYGVDFFTPIINPGNVGILGVGRVRDGVEWQGEVPRRVQVLTLSLTFDHRAVDGAPSAEFLKTVAGLLRTPLRLLST